MIAALKAASDAVKLAIGAVMGALVVFPVAYLIGRHDGSAAERQASLAKSIKVLQERSATNARVQNMDDSALCGAIGGRWVRDDNRCE